MAHGYLSVQDTRGDKDYLRNIGDILKALLDRGEENGAPPDKGGALVLQKKGNTAEVYKKPDPQDDRGGPLAKKGAGGLVGAFSQMVRSGGGAVAKASGRPALPPGGPRLPGAADAPTGGGGRKGGSFVDMGSSISKPLNADNFFDKAVNLGVDAETGEYLSKEERVARFKQGRVPSARAQAMGMGGGDNGGSIVSALANNTAAIVSAINNQTANDTNLKNQEMQASEQALADQKAMLKEQRAEEKGRPAGTSAIEAVGAGGAGGGGGGLLGGLGNMLGGVKGLKGLKGLGGLGKGLKGLKGVLGKGLGKGLAKGAGKGLMKGGLKMGLKKIPFLGLGAAALFAGQRALAGDFAGAGLELASGAAGTIPGLGTAASLGIDATLMARDANMPSMAGGGFTSGPKSGYLSMMHGDELTLSGSAGGETIKIGEKLGEGMFRTQKKRRNEYAKLSADGLSEYYDKRNGWEKFIEWLKGLLPWVDNPDFNIFKPSTWNKKKASKDNPPGNGNSKSFSKGNLTASDGTLKGKIRSLESGGDYGSTFKKYLDGFDRKDEDITKMSIADVVQYQKDYLAHQTAMGIPVDQQSAAVGAYQMLYPDKAAKELGIDMSAKFDQATQDKLAEYYLNMAGQQDYLSGKITAEQYNDGLAGQFASIKTTAGTGVYDNDGLNSAYGTVLDEIKATKAKKTKPEPVTTPLTKAFLGGRDFGLKTGEGLNVGVGGTSYRVEKTDDGFRVLDSGLFGAFRQEVNEVPKGLEEAFINRYGNRPDLNPTGSGEAAADALGSTSADVAAADRAARNGEVVVTAVMPETKSNESGRAGTEVAAEGVNGQGVLSTLNSIQLMR